MPIQIQAHTYHLQDSLLVVQVVSMNSNSNLEKNHEHLTNLPKEDHDMLLGFGRD